MNSGNVLGRLDNKFPGEKKKEKKILKSILEKDKKESGKIGELISNMFLYDDIKNKLIQRIKSSILELLNNSTNNDKKNEKKEWLSEDENKKIKDLFEGIHNQKKLNDILGLFFNVVMKSILTRHSEKLINMMKSPNFKMWKFILYIYRFDNVSKNEALNHSLLFSKKEKDILEEINKISWKDLLKFEKENKDLLSATGQKITTKQVESILDRYVQETIRYKQAQDSKYKKREESIKFIKKAIDTKIITYDQYIDYCIINMLICSDIIPDNNYCKLILNIVKISKKYYYNYYLSGRTTAPPVQTILNNIQKTTGILDDKNKRLISKPVNSKSLSKPDSILKMEQEIKNILKVDDDKKRLDRNSKFIVYFIVLLFEYMNVIYPFKIHNKIKIKDMGFLYKEVEKMLYMDLYSLLMHDFSNDKWQYKEDEQLDKLIRKTLSCMSYYIVYGSIGYDNLKLNNALKVESKRLRFVKSNKYKTDQCKDLSEKKLKENTLATINKQKGMFSKIKMRGVKFMSRTKNLLNKKKRLMSCKARDIYCKKLRAKLFVFPQIKKIQYDLYLNKNATNGLEKYKKILHKNNTNRMTTSPMAGEKYINSTTLNYNKLILL